MFKIYAFLIFSLLFCLLHVTVSAQKKDRVEAFSKISSENSLKGCKVPQSGQTVAFPKPVYPVEAKAADIGGTVTVKLKIDQKGIISAIESITGHRLLQPAAEAAARKSRFNPTTCADSARTISVVLTYNFIPFVATARYFTPTKMEDFADIKSDSQYYESVLNLTDNYRLAFGYDDKKFHADAPLTHGDFVHFLRLTLDLLSERAVAAGKLKREINLFNSYNPQNVTAVSIGDFKPNEAFTESIKTLLLKYDIALVNERKEFQGDLPLTNNEVIDIWSKIFGGEAIPVNFEPIADSDRMISRGEFALFLQESLQVLTYKVLP